MNLTIDREYLTQTLIDMVRIESINPSLVPGGSGEANVIAFKVGRGTVVALTSQVSFRTQPRATFKLLFNALYQGPATKLSSRELSRLSTRGGRTTEE